MGHDYDAAGRRELTRREDGTWWTYGYNTRSEVTAAAKHATTSALVPGLEFSYSYDGMGNRTNSSAGSGSGMAIRGFTPNALNQYSTLTNNAKLNLLVRSDAAITATASRGPHNGIDVQGQFYGIRQTANNAGNGKVVTTNVTRSGGGTSQVKTWVPPNSLTPTYDAGGKLLKDGRWDYTWDGESRIVKMVSSGSAKNAGAPNITLRFAYDWMGRRIGKSITEGTSTTHESYAYDGWNLIGQWNRTALNGSLSGTALQRTFLWGPDIASSTKAGYGQTADYQQAGGVAGLIACTYHNSTSSLEHYIPSYDANGNILAWTDGSGTVVQRMDYDPFGNTVMVEKLAPASTTKLPSIGFSTKYQDEETGLYYYGYRYYDPVTGRSPSRDPIEEEGGVNLYGFVGNDGMNRFDRLGLQTNWAWHANMPLYPSAPEPPASVLAQRDINSYSKAFSGTLVGEVAGINFALAKLEGRVSQARYIHCGILALGYATANPSAAALDSSGTKKLYIRPSAAKSLILHELVHAHNDATGMAIANSLMGEGMAYLLASNMDMLDIYLVKLEKAITEGVEEDVMRNAVAWSYFWESRETWSSTGWDDTVVSGTIFPKSSSDFTNLKVSLRINFSCQPLADAFNRILELRDGCIRFQRNSLALEIDGNHKLSYDANIKIGVEY